MNLWILLRCGCAWQAWRPATENHPGGGDLAGNSVAHPARLVKRHNGISVGGARELQGRLKPGCPAGGQARKRLGDEKGVLARPRTRGGGVQTLHRLDGMVDGVASDAVGCLDLPPRVALGIAPQPDVDAEEIAGGIVEHEAVGDLAEGVVEDHGTVLHDLIVRPAQWVRLHQVDARGELDESSVDGSAHLGLGFDGDIH